MTSLEQQTSQEVFARHLLLLIMVLAGCWTFSIFFPLIWFAAYAFTSLSSRVLLGRLADHRRVSDYALALCMYALRTATFRAMIIYLWVGPYTSWQFIALIMLMATLRFSINPKSRIRSYALITAFGDLTTLVVLSGLAIGPEPIGLDQPLVGLATAALSVYYIVTLLEAHKGLLEIEALEQQSRQAQKMEAIGRLTGGVAHDFNNILTVVNGNLELFDEVTDPKEQAALVHQARDAAARATLLTAQLLAFSRQTPLRRDKVDTAEFLRHLETLTARVLPANIAVAHEINPDVWPMFVDRVQLEVALLNLIINARDAMPTGGTITLEAQNEDLLTPRDGITGTRFVVLSLKDTGHGIPAHLMNQVTEPFFTTKPVGEGSGLGLSMVKGFAEQSGGELRLHSKELVGTTVAMSIPAAAGRETVSDAPSPSAEPDI